MVDLKTILRRVGLAVAVFAFFFLLLAAGFRAKAAKAYGEAVQAEESGDLTLAVGLYDRAIRNHYPFSGVGKRSRDRLLAIAEGYERSGEKEKARSAYQTLLSALCAVETGLSGNRELADSLEKKVEDLLPPPPSGRKAQNPAPEN